MALSRLRLQSQPMAVAILLANSSSQLALAWLGITTCDCASSAHILSGTRFSTFVPGATSFPQFVVSPPPRPPFPFHRYLSIPIHNHVISPPKQAHPKDLV